MPRLQGNYVQNMHTDDIAELPKLCTYEGDDQALHGLIGLLLPTARAEELVYIGERENIWVEDYEGKRWQPWKDVWIYEVDIDGKPAPIKHEAAVQRGQRAMATGDLASLGYTDAILNEMALELLGEEWIPDRPGPSDKRREMYDRVREKMSWTEEER